VKNPGWILVNDKNEGLSLIRS